jgi:precorrin-4 methylase
MNTLIFYSLEQKHVALSSLYVSIDFPVYVRAMCRTIDDKIIDIMFCHMRRSTDAEVIHKTNTSIIGTCVHQQLYR